MSKSAAKKAPKELPAARIPDSEADLTFLSNGTATATPYGLQIHRALTFEEWQRHMKSIRTVKCAYLLLLGDLTRHGIEQFGVEAVSREMEQLEFELSDATKADAIGQLPLDLRTRHKLGSEISFVLATCLDDEKEREKWAATASREKLNAFELKASIKAGRILRRDEIEEKTGHGGGIQTIQGVRFQFDRWLRNTDRNALLKKPPEEKRQLLELLLPVIELATQLEESLNS